MYIYPEAADIDAVAQAVASGQTPSQASLYWSAASQQGDPEPLDRATDDPRRLRKQAGATLEPEG